MKSISGKKLGQILEKKGRRLIRIKGSHYRYQKNHTSISIPVHGNQDLKIGLLKYEKSQFNRVGFNLMVE
ncbi:hypothetical protein GM3708_434 [Geminocystis sp. NIES-3708]|uniref:type II toxin-antitoxin system HicA family toxin n=1 Tax=Geminocystis sp. NIES-3708 TaxID=1615909 RepID=UPI0005FC96A6|nr:hypothetical protein GM3708_434 [Geminocystis sp. NIES-3708]